MKQTRFSKSFILLMGLFLLGALNACNNPIDEDLKQDSPRLQADGRAHASGGGGDEIRDKCRVTVSDWNFTTSYLVLMPATPYYDFAINVLSHSDCDMSVVDGRDCKSSKLYFLGFNPLASIPLSLNDFSAIAAFNSNGGGVDFTLDDQNQGIWVELADAQINFKWNPNSPSAGNVDPDAFRTGGNCIIDIVTDPNGSGDGSGGSTGGTSSGGSNG